MCLAFARSEQGGQGGWSQVNKGESGRNKLGERGVWDLQSSG